VGSTGLVDVVFNGGQVWVGPVAKPRIRKACKDPRCDQPAIPAGQGWCNEHHKIWWNEQYQEREQKRLEAEAERDRNAKERLRAEIERDRISREMRKEHRRKREEKRLEQKRNSRAAGPGAPRRCSGRTGPVLPRQRT
jgi:hypothetical protein